MPNYGLQEKVALITGANNPQGIGATTALSFAREGAKVVLVYKKIDRAFDETKIDQNGADRYYAANAGNADAVEIIHHYVWSVALRITKSIQYGIENVIKHTLVNNLKPQGFIIGECRAENLFVVFDIHKIRGEVLIANEYQIVQFAVFKVECN